MKFTALLAALFLAILVVGCDEPADDAAPDESEEAVEEEEEEEEASDDGDDGEPAEEYADDLEPGKSGHYGAPFSLEDDPVALADAIADLDAAVEQEGDDARLDDLKISGRIEHVCQSKGCWFTLEADDLDLTVRIRMEDYAFFVPRNASGADAVIEGSLQRVTVNEKMARHLAEDQGIEDVDSIEGDEENYLIMARGIALTLSDS